MGEAQMRGMGWVAMAGLVASMVASAGIARAQSSEPAMAEPSTRETDMAEAAMVEGRAEFRQGEEAYAAGRFEEALAHFSRSYELTDEPKLLYNLGLASGRLRRDEEALAYFRRYLRSVPAADNREQVEAQIRVLQSSVSEQSAALPPAESVVEEEPTPSAPTDDEETRLAPWIVGGSGLAVGGAGGVLLALGASANRTVANATTWAEAADAHDRGPTLGRVGAVALGLGVLAIGAAVVWLLLDGKDGDEVADRASLTFRF